MNIYLQTTQFQYRKDAVTHVLRAPAPFNTLVVPSTEADIRAGMTTPADNWGNADAVLDAQAKVDALYPEWAFTVLPEPIEDEVP